ncbi:hypothetical protein MMC17_007702 [Xylographa soralifera]|nr:hypothetical protein [Xylographa soralifera]
MPLTDSEATIAGFWVGEVGFVITGTEYLVVWGRRLWDLCVLTDDVVKYSYFGWAEASWQPPTEAEYNGMKARLRDAEGRAERAEGRATTAEGLLKTERQLHQTTVDGLVHRNQLQKLQNDLLVAQTRLDCLAEAEARTRAERAERMVLLRTGRRRRQGLERLDHI